MDDESSDDDDSVSNYNHNDDFDHFYPALMPGSDHESYDELVDDEEIFDSSLYAYVNPGVDQAKKFWRIVTLLRSAGP